MRFYFFASFIVFCIWLGYEIHKRRNKEEVPKAARILPEFAVSTHTDIYASHELLIPVYEKLSEES